MIGRVQPVLGTGVPNCLAPSHKIKNGRGMASEHDWMHGAFWCRHIGGFVIKGIIARFVIKGIIGGFIIKGIIGG